MPHMMETPIRPQVAHALGVYISHWNAVENSLWLLVADMLGIQDQFRVRLLMANFHSFRAQRNLVESLGHTYLDAEHAKKLKTLLQRADKLAKERNNLVHGKYAVGNTDDSNLLLLDRSLPGKGLQLDSQQVDAAYILERCDKVRILGSDISWFNRGLHTTPGAIFQKAKMHRDDKKTDQ